METRIGWGEVAVILALAVAALNLLRDLFGITLGRPWLERNVNRIAYALIALLGSVALVLLVMQSESQTSMIAEKDEMLASASATMASFAMDVATFESSCIAVDKELQSARITQTAQVALVDAVRATQIAQATELALAQAVATKTEGTDEPVSALAATPTEALTASPVPTLRPPAASITPTTTSTPYVATVWSDIFEQAAGGETFFWEWPVYSESSSIVDQNIGACSHTGAIGLRLEYNFNGESESHCGWGVTWEKTHDTLFDASGFSDLIFWVRLESGNGTFDVGLKGKDGREVKYTPSVETTGVFEKVEIPLDYYAERGVNLAELQVVSFGFSSNYGSGTICIDDIEFK